MTRRRLATTAPRRRQRPSLLVTCALLITITAAYTDTTTTKAETTTTFVQPVDDDETEPISISPSSPKRTKPTTDPATTSSSERSAPLFDNVKSTSTAISLLSSSLGEKMKTTLAPTLLSSSKTSAPPFDNVKSTSTPISFLSLSLGEKMKTTLATTLMSSSKTSASPFDNVGSTSSVFSLSSVPTPGKTTTTFNPMPLSSSSSTSASLLDSDKTRSTSAGTTLSSSSSLLMNERVKPSPATVDPSCYSLLRQAEFDLHVHPPGGPRVYQYNRGQNVTLTCEVKDAMRPDANSGGLPYVFIKSCKPCANGSFIQSEAGRGRAELVLEGRSGLAASIGVKRGCQFSCWRYHDHTCGTKTPTPGLFQPAFFDCAVAPDGHFRTVRFGESPTSLGVECVSKNWGGLKCTWTLQKGTHTWPQNNDAALVSYFSYHESLGEVEDSWNTTAPVVRDGDRLTVQTEVEQNHYYQLEAYSFIFRLHGPFGTVRTVHNVTADTSIVRFDPVTNQRAVTPNDSDCGKLRVSWGFPKPAQGLERWLECRLHLASSEPWLSLSTREVTVPAVDCRQRRPVTEVSGLHCAVNYTLQVQFRFEQSQYWSEPAMTWATTGVRAPDMTYGGYVLWSCEPNECLTLYWKALTPHQRSGSPAMHTILIDPLADGSGPDTGSGGPESLFNATFPANMCSASLRLSPPATGRQGPRRACVSAPDANGSSDMYQCITIPGSDTNEVPQSSPQVWSEFLSSNNSFVVMWTADSYNNATADYLTVFWCKGQRLQPGVVQCQSDMNWEHVSPNTTSFVMDSQHTSAFDSAEDMWHFGLAVVKDNRSLGITWSSYSFRDNGQDLDRQQDVLEVFRSSNFFHKNQTFTKDVVPIPEFTVEESEKMQVAVTWSLMCNTAVFMFARPRAFQVLHGKLTGSRDYLQCPSGNTTYVAVQVGQMTFRHVITDLQPGATYSLCLKAMYDKETKESIARTITLASRDEETEDGTALPIVIIAFGMAVTVATIIGIIGHLRRRLNKARKKFTKEIDFGIPEIPSPGDRTAKSLHAAELPACSVPSTRVYTRPTPATPKVRPGQDQGSRETPKDATATAALPAATKTSAEPATAATVAAPAASLAVATTTAVVATTTTTAELALPPTTLTAMATTAAMRAEGTQSSWKTPPTVIPKDKDDAIPREDSTAGRQDVQGEREAVISLSRSSMATYVVHDRHTCHLGYPGLIPVAPASERKAAEDGKQVFHLTAGLGRAQPEEPGPGGLKCGSNVAGALSELAAADRPGLVDNAGQAQGEFHVGDLVCSEESGKEEHEGLLSGWEDAGRVDTSPPSDKVDTSIGPYLRLDLPTDQRPKIIAHQHVHFQAYQHPVTFIPYLRLPHLPDQRPKSLHGDMGTSASTAPISSQGYVRCPLNATASTEEQEERRTGDWNTHSARDPTRILTTPIDTTSEETTKEEHEMTVFPYVTMDRSGRTTLATRSVNTTPRGVKNEKYTDKDDRERSCTKMPWFSPNPPWNRERADTSAAWPATLAREHDLLLQYQPPGGPLGDIRLTKSSTGDEQPSLGDIQKKHGKKPYAAPLDKKPLVILHDKYINVDCAISVSPEPAPLSDTTVI